MQTKSAELMNSILIYIDEVYQDEGTTPSVREIAAHFNISKSCVSNYIAALRDKGMLESTGKRRRIRTQKMCKLQQEIEFLPVIGSIACGTPMFAEQNIETYIPLSKDFLGSGSYFLLKAYGNSMINAGIDDGDLVLVRQQEEAEEGQIVVALIDNETTLKRFYLDSKKKCIRLHPENDEMEDMFFDNVNIQGVAVKVIKEL